MPLGGTPHYLRNAVLNSWVDLNLQHLQNHTLVKPPKKTTGPAFTNNNSCHSQSAMITKLILLFWAAITAKLKRKSKSAVLG